MTFKQYSQNVWLDVPAREDDDFNYIVKDVPVNQIEEPEGFIPSRVKKIQTAFQNGIKLPLITLEYKNNIYLIQDGWHRLTAYLKEFPQATKVKAALFTSWK